jgi:hypothetical protein
MLTGSPYRGWARVPRPCHLAGSVASVSRPALQWEPAWTTTPAAPIEAALSSVTATRSTELSKVASLVEAKLTR